MYPLRFHARVEWLDLCRCLCGLPRKDVLKARPYGAVLTTYSDRVQCVCFVWRISRNARAADTFLRYAAPASATMCPWSITAFHVSLVHCVIFLACSSRRGRVRKSPSSKRRQGPPAQRRRFGPGTARIVREAHRVILKLHSHVHGINSCPSVGVGVHYCA